MQEKGLEVKVSERRFPRGIVTLDKPMSDLLSLPERARKGDFAPNLSRGGRLSGERLRKVPREIGSSNVFPPCYPGEEKRDITE